MKEVQNRRKEFVEFKELVSIISEETYVERINGVKLKLNEHTVLRLRPF